MKSVKFLSFFLFAILCCTSYAHENNFVFVGQNGAGECTQTAFILELLGDNLENHVMINENGEVYLKVDKIIAIPKEALNHFPITADTSFPGNGEVSLTKASRNDWSFKWTCPHCGRENGPFDGSCQNKKCPGKNK